MAIFHVFLASVSFPPRGAEVGGSAVWTLEWPMVRDISVLLKAEGGGWGAQESSLTADGLCGSSLPPNAGQAHRGGGQRQPGSQPKPEGGVSAESKGFRDQNSLT